MELMLYPTWRNDQPAIVVAGDAGVQFTAIQQSDGVFAGDWMRLHPCAVRLRHLHNSMDSFVRDHAWFNGETVKSQSRRLRTDWYRKFAPHNLSGIDIGCGFDPLNTSFRRWDVTLGDGDATFLDGIVDASMQTVYASHVLEHLRNPVEALRNWWRVLASSGHLIVSVPHRDLYEMRNLLPSIGNPDHKSFYLPDRDDAPHTLSLRRILNEALPNGHMISFSTETEGYRKLSDSVAAGEYSIEAVIRKP